MLHFSPSIFYLFFGFEKNNNWSFIIKCSNYRHKVLTMSKISSDMIEIEVDVELIPELFFDKLLELYFSSYEKHIN